MGTVTDRITAFLGSRKFYWFVLGFFVLEALWIAFSAVYPMAFDEDFHLGIIRIYSEQWSPILSVQPQNADRFGSLATDPSYLFHYLMSFPYRLVSIFTDSETAHVIALRLLNVGMMTAGVVLMRRVLLRAGTSAALANASLLLFALIPTVPLLAGQINYDNLMLLGLAAVLLVLLDITRDLRARKFNLASYVLLVVLLILNSLVKYPFLPIALAAVVYVLYMLWRTFRGQRFGQVVKKSYAALSRRTVIWLSVLFVVSSGLFLQSYGQNLLTYRHPVPDCGKVIGIEACLEYGPWGRNYRYAAAKPESFTPDPLWYASVWLQSLHYRLFFVVNGPPLYVNYPPAPLPSATAIPILVAGLLSLFFFTRKIFSGRPFLVFLLLTTILYAVALWSFNTYPQYVETGQPVAINGRYFIPLLLPMVAVFGRGLGIALRRQSVKVVFASAAIVLFLQGGGVSSFILRSDESWYWDSRAVVEVNEAARDVLSRVIFIGPKEY